MAALACACDGGTAAPPVDPDDVDADGIPNAEDLCPAVADPAQHDEDGDGFGDACDVCATIPDPDQGDVGERDGLAFPDGVGDVCDLRPTRGGDKLRALHTFATDTSAAWLGMGWAIAGDRARASGDARWQNKRGAQGDAVFARLAVEALALQAPGAAVSIFLDGDGVEGGSACALIADRDGDGRDELQVRELGGATAVRALPGPATAPLELAVIRGVDRTGGSVLCILSRGSGEPIKALIPTIDNLPAGQYGIAAEDADVTVTSLAVYGSPVACLSTSLACPSPGQAPEMSAE